MQLNIIQKSADVFQASGPITHIGQKEIAYLKIAVKSSPKKRVRINVHQRNEDLLHEMFIAIEPGSYIRPHKHPGKSEAFHVVYGMVDVIVLDDSGEIIKIVSLAANSETLPFYYRMSEPMFHTLIIRTELLVVHEITNGPFVAGSSIYAPFSPIETDELMIAAYQKDLTENVRKIKAANE